MQHSCFEQLWHFLVTATLVNKITIFSIAFIVALPEVAIDMWSIRYELT